MTLAATSAFAANPIFVLNSLDASVSEKPTSAPPNDSAAAWLCWRISCISSSGVTRQYSTVNSASNSAPLPT